MYSYEQRKKAVELYFQYNHSLKAVLRDELLAVYEFLDKQGLLKAYKKYRDEECKRHIDGV